MFKNLLFTFFLIFSSITTIYPTKKENTNLMNYCHSFEKIISRNSVENFNNLSNNLKPIAKDITFIGTNQTKGALANKIIDQYKTSKNSLIITIVPNEIYCLAGYWIEELNPGTFKSILFKKSKERINQYKDIKKEVDEFFKDFNSEYKPLKIEINDLF